MFVVPGVSSALAAPAAAGVPVTHRGVAHEWVVVSGHLPPDHPQSLVDWPASACRGDVSTASPPSPSGRHSGPPAIVVFGGVVNVFDDTALATVVPTR